MPVVSVIVPTRNSARTLESCLKSIKAQSFKDFELIVVDNESADQTVEIAHRYADAVENCGPERSAQRNWGVRRALGSYLLFIDSDMVLDDRVIEECLQLAEGERHPAVIIPEVTIGDGFWARCRTLERSCYDNDNLVEAARFFRREVFEAVGGYDEDLVGGEDWDLSRRVRGPFPRIRSRILHDEGFLQLSQHLAKKRYYSRSFVRYWQKHGLEAMRQANVIVRPAFLLHWRTLIRHPLLMIGMLVLKVLETVVSVQGMASYALRPKSLHTNTRGH